MEFPQSKKWEKLDHSCIYERGSENSIKNCPVAEEIESRVVLAHQYHCTPHTVANTHDSLLAEMDSSENIAMLEEEEGQVDS